MFLHRLCVLLLCVIGMQAAFAAPSAAELELSLVGHWQGALEYRDYQSDGLLRLPMQTRISVGPDGATLTRLSSFDDGPQTGIVTITTVGLFDRAGTQLSSATFRKGRAVESFSDDARVTQWQDAQHWTLVYQRRGLDNNQVADIRVTQTRKGAELRAVKEVKAVDQSDSAYAFRNQTVLRLQP
jgi:hypothetical protein